MRYYGRTGAESVLELSGRDHDKGKNNGHGGVGQGFVCIGPAPDVGDAAFDKCLFSTGGMNLTS